MGKFGREIRSELVERFGSERCWQWESMCNTGVFHYQHFHLSGQGQSVARE